MHMIFIRVFSINYQERTSAASEEEINIQTKLYVQVTRVIICLLYTTVCHKLDIIILKETKSLVWVTEFTSTKRVMVVIKLIKSNGSITTKINVRLITCVKIYLFRSTRKWYEAWLYVL